MNPIKLIYKLIMVSLLITKALSMQCNSSHFDFISKYSLGKQAEINRTFTKIQKMIFIIGNVTFKDQTNATYTIFNARPTFYYRDSQQKASIPSIDTVIIDGGYLQVGLSFNWMKQGALPRNGIGIAQALSDQVIFAKQLIIAHGFYFYKLLDAMNITFTTQNAFILYRIDPPQTTNEDITVLLNMMNKMQNVRTVSVELQDQIFKYYNDVLSQSLEDQHQPTDYSFNYTWVPNTKGKGNVTVNFTRRSVKIDVQAPGLLLIFEAQVKNDNNWKCGNRTVPTAPLQPAQPIPNHSQFGGAQQFISYDFYQSTLHYAIQQSYIDTILNRQNWQSRMFQFYVGDLYQVLPMLQDKFYAKQSIIGVCKATYANLNIQKSGQRTINASLHYDCMLQVQGQKIIEFGIDLELTLEGVPTSTTLDFKMRSHAANISFNPYGDYKLQKTELAKAMVRDSINRLYESNPFGSNYPLSPPRDYLHFVAKDNYTIVYDSSQVPTSQ